MVLTRSSPLADSTRSSSKAQYDFRLDEQDWEKVCWGRLPKAVARSPAHQLSRRAKWAAVLRRAATPEGGSWQAEFKPEDMTPHRLQALARVIDQEFFQGTFHREISRRAGRQLLYWSGDLDQRNGGGGAILLGDAVMSGHVDSTGLASIYGLPWHRGVSERGTGATPPGVYSGAAVSAVPAPAVAAVAVSAMGQWANAAPGLLLTAAKCCTCDERETPGRPQARFNLGRAGALVSAGPGGLVRDVFQSRGGFRVPEAASTRATAASLSWRKGCGASSCGCCSCRAGGGDGAAIITNATSAITATTAAPHDGTGGRRGGEHTVRDRWGWLRAFRRARDQDRASGAGGGGRDGGAGAPGLLAVVEESVAVAPSATYQHSRGRVTFWRQVWGSYSPSVGKPMRLDGVVCTSRLSWLAHTLGHEMLHALLFHMCGDYARAAPRNMSLEGHGYNFLMLNWYVLGHQGYTYNPRGLRPPPPLPCRL